jgi:CheY-like chemotaxis protein
MLVDEEHHAPASRVSPAGRTVLVVEDEWLMASALAELLAGEGFAVAGPVGSVEAALATMGATAVDAALLDIDLGNGRRVFDMARILMALHVPFAFLTGYSPSLTPTDLRDCPRLQKPVDKQDVLRMLERICHAPSDRR